MISTHQMRSLSYIFLLLVISCTPKKSQIDQQETLWTKVEIQEIYKDSISIRAIEIIDSYLIFSCNKGTYGFVGLEDHSLDINTIEYKDKTPEFRAIAHTSKDVFLLSVASPALLYKLNKNSEPKLVYKEEGEGVFYDSMSFWNDQEGIAIGDKIDSCLSIIITRDGGDTWSKIDCAELPFATPKESAFAASNSNISIAKNKVWVATSSSRIYISEDKGSTWKVVETPIVKDKDTEGIYSIDFYDSQIGFAIGGDYTNPNSNNNNKAITRDGGDTWKTVADGQNPNYKSCIQFVPESGGEKLVAVGFTGINYSNDFGESWTSLSDSSFYTIRFLDSQTAYAAGKNIIAKLKFI